MDVYLIPAIAALAASALTFFSGFGLGTILTPVFALFYPIDVAIGLTAIVHFLNNVVKFGLMRPHTDWKVLAKFGIPAFIAAIGGALLLQQLSGLDQSITYQIFNAHLSTSGLQILIGVLIALFALFELLPGLKSIQLNEQFLIPGGFLSGFFGGLSGHQGALRSAFLIRALSDKNAFVATGIAIALVVDITRIPIYFSQATGDFVTSAWDVLLVSLLAAITGALVGRKLLQKTTIHFLQQLVGWLLLVIGFLLALGVI